VPTDTGEFQVWDIFVGSATFRKQVGAIPSPDPNLTGKMAIDPAGDRLLALASTGELLAFDLGRTPSWSTWIWESNRGMSSSTPRESART